MLILINIFISFFAHGFEVDNYTCRYEELADVSSQLNGEVNRRLNEVINVGSYSSSEVMQRLLEVREANERRDRVRAGGLTSLNSWESMLVGKAIMGGDYSGGAIPEDRLREWFNNPEVEPSPVPLVGCDRTELHSAIRGILASGWVGNMETWATEQSFDQCDPEASIYTGFRFTEAPVLLAAGLNPVIRVGNVRLGVDKLSHFMTEGYDYYQAQLRGQSLPEILNIGEGEEDGHFGIAVTGIRSYGDLAANYSGYTFWRSLTDGPTPYVRCVAGRWRQVRQFDWNDYVNPAFDESINCSAYRNDRMQGVVDANTRELQRRNNATPLTCPLDPQACRSMDRYYPEAAVRNSVIHPRCLNVGLSPSPERGAGNESVN